MHGFFRAAWKRRVGVLGLALVIGVTSSDRAASSTGPLPPAAGNLGFLASGILYGTVLSRMDPGIRKSILAALDGVSEAGAGSPSKPHRQPTRCGAARVCPSRTIRCSRA